MKSFPFVVLTKWFIDVTIIYIHTVGFCTDILSWIICRSYSVYCRSYEEYDLYYYVRTSSNFIFSHVRIFDRDLFNENVRNMRTLILNSANDTFKFVKFKKRTKMRHLWLKMSLIHIRQGSFTVGQYVRSDNCSDILSEGSDICVETPYIFYVESPTPMTKGQIWQLL